MVTRQELIGHRSSEIAGLKIPPELELLLSSARRNLSADRARHALELLDQPLDWSLLVDWQL